MTSPLEFIEQTNESGFTDCSVPTIAEFFRESEGKWHSERRYYTLPDGKTKEVESAIAVRFLEAGCDELVLLAQMHGLPSDKILICGTEVIWESTNSQSGKKESQGSTLFGAKDNILYRDRGFATSKPITAEYHLPNAKTLCLRTEYNGSVFEEELKLIGTKYRTRQSVISRAGEQIMIGQYLEKRIEE